MHHDDSQINQFISYQIYVRSYSLINLTIGSLQVIIWPQNSKTYIQNKFFFGQCVNRWNFNSFIIFFRKKKKSTDVLRQAPGHHSINNPVNYTTDFHSNLGNIEKLQPGASLKLQYQIQMHSYPSERQKHRQWWASMSPFVDKDYYRISWGGGGKREEMKGQIQFYRYDLQGSPLLPSSNPWESTQRITPNLRWDPKPVCEIQTTTSQKDGGGEEGCNMTLKSNAV